jgi:hypothetical protein
MPSCLRGVHDLRADSTTAYRINLNVLRYQLTGAGLDAVDRASLNLKESVDVGRSKMPTKPNHANTVLGFDGAGVDINPVPHGRVYDRPARRNRSFLGHPKRRECACGEN